MKCLVFLLPFVLMLSHGCIMVKIGGVKSTEKSELSRNLREMHMELLASIEPRLTQAGELTLWVSGRFEGTYDVRNKVTNYGDEWMAIGLFPGYDDMSNGYSNEKGIKTDCVSCVVVPVILNSLLCGVYTVASLLEPLDPTSAKRNSGFHVAIGGLIGTYKYEGSKYLLSAHEEKRVDVKSDDSPRLLKGFCITIGNVKLNDRNGVVALGKKIKVGDVVGFKIVTIPQDPQADKDVFAPFIGREFKVICR